MKLLILSRNGRLYSTRRLVAAARARGHAVRVLDPLRCCLQIGAARPAIHYQGRPLRGIDAVLPRIGVQTMAYGAAVLRQLEMQGVYTPNGSDAILNARDKLRALQMLAAAGLALPLTVYGDHPDDTRDLMKMLGPPPHVIKLNQGSQGSGVVLAEKAVASQSVIEAFRGLCAPFVVQEYIQEAEGRDLRCLVVGGEVAAAMQRQASPGDFRANLHRGGSAQSVTLTAAERVIAIRAAAALGLGVAGVDLLRSARGPLLLEVNASPGLEGVESCTGVEVAEAIIALLEQQATGPNVAVPGGLAARS